MFDVILYNSSILGDMDGVRHALGNGGRVGFRAPLGLTFFLLFRNKNEIFFWRI